MSTKGIKTQGKASSVGSGYEIRRKTKPDSNENTVKEAYVMGMTYGNYVVLLGDADSLRRAMAAVGIHSGAATVEELREEILKRWRR